MAASGYTPVSLYHSSTPAAQPAPENLVDGELAINIADGYLFYKDNFGVVKTITGSSGGGSTATYVRTSFNVTAPQTTFFVSYTVGYIEVYLNGVLLNSGDYTANNETSVILASAAINGDIVETIAFNVVSVASGTSGYSGYSGYSGISSPTATATYVKTSFTATAGQTTFSVVYTVGYVEVYLNGVLLNSTDYTATNGTSIVLTSAASLGDIVETIAFNVVAVNGLGSYSITESGGKLVFKYGATTIASLDSSGNFIALNNITAYGTP
jgi:hypothetical protein